MKKKKIYDRSKKLSPSQDRYVSLTEASRICRCSKTTFQKWAEKYDITRKTLDSYFNPISKKTSTRIGYLESEVRNFRNFISGKYLSVGVLVSPSRYSTFGKRYSVFSNFFSLGKASADEDFDIVGVDVEFIKNHSAELLSLSRNTKEVYFLNDDREDSEQTYSYRQFKRLVSKRIRQLGNRYSPGIEIEGLEDE